LLFAAVPALAAEPREGVRPVGADGKPLNLDFETGDLRDWTATGDAFKGQPVKGDTVYPRRNDMKSEHQGQYWIGTFERAGDPPQGTLTSVPFKVTHPWASFLVAGGPWPETCVEIHLKDGDKIIARVSGIEEENLKRVAVDLRPHVGKEIYIRLVDKHSGHWGHINFDDFRFHATQPNVPERKTAAPLPGPDQYKYAGLPPKKAAEVMTVPEGFKVTLFAGEPDVVQPIAFTIDDRGRLWVAEAMVYPQRLPFKGPLLPEDQRSKGDRIVIFEDTDGDGVFDKKTVFMEGLNLVSGLEVGFGGVWIGAAPYLLFVPAKDDKPAGPPQILLDGWHYEDTHETLNAFTWGPDGWLYGCHGVFTHSLVGKPGTPAEKRTPINAGIWRYHPTRHEFELFGEGTSNPWGLDFNEYGDCFVEACVIPHLFHIFQGGRYNRQAGQHFNPYTYADIQTIADHRHYVGPNPHGGNNRSDSMGGGHAHCGLMCYLGGAWPKEYAGKLFMGNIHGRRINMDVLKPQGSGYVASHGNDFLLANDAWARFINLKCGPDGNVYLIDWYDKQACHLPQPEVWDRSNGRIFKISYRGTKPVVGIDLQKCSDEELVQYQLHENEWYARHARRILQERFAAFERSDVDKNAAARKSNVRASLAQIAQNDKDETRRLRALWTLHAAGGMTEAIALQAMGDKSAHVRAFAIQLAGENRVIGADSVRNKLLSMAKDDPSPVVRRFIASLCQLFGTSLADRASIKYQLISHAEDAADPNLPLLYWYALEQQASDDGGELLRLVDTCPSPRLVEFALQRAAVNGTPAMENLIRFVGAQGSEEKQAEVVRAVLLGLAQHKTVEAPPSWPRVYSTLKRKRLETRVLIARLSVKFGDSRGLESLAEIASDKTADARFRKEALASLVASNDPKLRPILHSLIFDADLRAEVIRALAAYSDPEIATTLVKLYPTLNSAEKRDTISTLSSRAVFAKNLLKAIGDKKIPAGDVSADIVRQLGNLRDADIDKQIAAVWGVVRSTPADRLRMMKTYRNKIVSGGPAPDLMLGRAIFAKTCQNCHTLFAVGGKVGPDITGANRADLNYLIENVIDPSAVIPKEYVATRIDLKNGRTVTGIVKERNANTWTVVTATETLTIPRSEIDEFAESATSMMPDDQLKPMSDHEVRSLFAYLQSPTQVPMLATPENAKDFFNGKDLTGWYGDEKLWSVENGEIVGKSPGIKQNEFLKSHLAAADFVLTLKIKLVPNKENSGIQFRSEPFQGNEMRGPQADVGAGWWGKLYEENVRGLIWDKSGEKHVKVDDWNEYKVEAIGPRVRTWINGQLCVDLTDEKISLRGIFGLQIHAGGPMEVRFKEIKLEVK
jgi:putative membrane-bound dehydrogenase-like protein